MLGIETAPRVAGRRDAEGKAVGGACRHAGRAIEECYALNKQADKAAVFAGWREMNDYMRENKIEAIAARCRPPSCAGGRGRRAAKAGPPKKAHGRRRRSCRRQPGAGGGPFRRRRLQCVACRVAARGAGPAAQSWLPLDTGGRP